MEIGGSNSDISQLGNLEHECVCFIFGVMKAPFVVTLESIFGRAASDQPVVLRDAKFLVTLASDRHTTVASNTTCADKFLQTQLGRF